MMIYDRIVVIVAAKLPFVVSLDDLSTVRQGLWRELGATERMLDAWLRSEERRVGKECRL